jgi:hypothetical protein
VKIRQGRKNPHNLYLMLGPEASDDDLSLGYIRTPGWAAQLVAAVNGVENPRQSFVSDVEWERAEELRPDRLGPSEDDLQREEEKAERPGRSLGELPKI